MEENNQGLESSPEVTQEQPTPTQAQTDADRNFAALREKTKKIERERDEYQQRLAQYEAQQKQQEPVRQKNTDDLAEYGDVQNVEKKLNAALSELKLRTDHPDIYQVVSKDNVDKLREQDPELAQMIYETQFQDPTKAMKMAYKFIKKMNIEPVKDYQKEKDIIEENASKPKSSGGTTRATPLSQANEYMEDIEAKRKRLYRQMVADASHR